MPRCLLPRRLFALLLATWLLLTPAQGAAAWRPLSPEDLAAQPPEKMPDAGALVLLREITIDNGDFDGAMQSHYVRTKVFDQKGVDALITMSIPYEKGMRPRDIAARVIKPDGSTVEVDKTAVFTREVVRIGREAMLVKSFTFPALTPGCILEYQYKLYSDNVLLGMHLPMSDDFPVAQIRIRMKNFGLPGLGVRSIWSRELNLKALPKMDRGFQVFEGGDVLPVTHEPLSGPDSIVKPWFSFYFTPPDTPEYNFWSYVAGELAAAGQQMLATKKPVKDLALKITAGIPDDRTKLRRLYDYCRTQIKNVSHDTSGYTPEQIDALKPNRSPSDVIKNGYGTAGDINVLFAAMVRALGAQCSLAYCGDRSEYIFHPELKLRAALPHVVVGIKVGGAYEFYDPGALYLPVGELRWMNDTTKAIVIEGEFFQMIDISATPPEYSTTSRTAEFRLDADGNLEGDVSITLTGHDGTAAKHDLDARTEEERRKTILDPLQERLPGAELSDLVFENITNPDAPVKIRYHVRVPGYAEVTADRIFLQPAFFQRGAPALFTSGERATHMYFPYPYTTIDQVTILLPTGFELEVPRAPGTVNTDGLLFYEPTLEHATTAGALIFKRHFTSNPGIVSRDEYALVKRSYDRVAAHDAHRIALRRSTVAVP